MESRDVRSDELGAHEGGAFSLRGLPSFSNVQYGAGYSLECLSGFVWNIAQFSVGNVLRILALLAYRIALEPFRDLYRLATFRREDRTGSEIGFALLRTVARFALVPLAIAAPVLPAITAAVAVLKFLPVIIKTAPVLTVLVGAVVSLGVSLLSSVFESVYHAKAGTGFFFVLPRTCAERAMAEDTFGDRGQALEQMGEIESGGPGGLFQEFGYWLDEVAHGMAFHTPFDGWLFRREVGKVEAAEEVAEVEGGSKVDCLEPPSHFWQGWSDARDARRVGGDARADRKLIRAHLFSPDLDFSDEPENTFLRVANP